MGEDFRSDSKGNLEINAIEKTRMINGGGEILWFSFWKIPIQRSFRSRIMLLISESEGKFSPSGFLVSAYQLDQFHFVRKLSFGVNEFVTVK